MYVRTYIMYLRTNLCIHNTIETIPVKYIVILFSLNITLVLSHLKCVNFYNIIH